LFGAKLNDVLSGYRAFSKRFMSTTPILSRGFEIETELSVHALELRVATRELDVAYCGRVEGSTSKLSSIRDGFAILVAIFNLFRTTAPMQFYCIISIFLATTAVILGYPLVTQYIESGLVPRVPTAILASALMILSGLSFMSGIIMSKLSLLRRDLKKMEFMRYPILHDRDRI
jgi:hypothetical protein